MHRHAPWAVGLVLFGGCLVPNADHCANNGNACESGFVCDACAWKNDGCVAELEANPSPECRTAKGVGTATQGGTGGGASMGSNGTAGDATATAGADDGSDDVDETPSACSDDDATCGGTTPYCRSGECVGCASLSEGCEAVSSARPVCDSDSGRCVQCLPNEAQACEGATPVCGEEASCRACQRHDECPRSACQMRTGACFPVEHVYHVDAAATCGGDGSQEAAFCSFAEAAGALANVPVFTLRVADGSYQLTDTFDIGSQRVAIVGDGNVRLHENLVSYSQVGIQAFPGAELYLAGLRVEQFNARNVQCDDASLHLDDVRLFGSGGAGVFATNCDVTIARARVHDNDGGGLQIHGGTLRLENSFITGSGATSLAVAGLAMVGVEADIVYTTIAGNYPTRYAVGCGSGTSGSIRNSIIVRDNAVANSVDCSPSSLPISNSALDDEDYASSNDNVRVEQGAVPFVALTQGDAHLSEAGALEGVAVWRDGDPVHDIDGEPRGGVDEASDVAGADVP